MELAPCRIDRTHQQQQVLSALEGVLRIVRASVSRGQRGDPRSIYWGPKRRRRRPCLRPRPISLFGREDGNTPPPLLARDHDRGRRGTPVTMGTAGQPKLSREDNDGQTPPYP